MPYSYAANLFAPRKKELSKHRVFSKFAALPVINGTSADAAITGNAADGSASHGRRRWRMVCTIGIALLPSGCSYPRDFGRLTRHRNLASCIIIAHAAVVHYPAADVQRRTIFRRAAHDSHFCASKTAAKAQDAVLPRAAAKARPKLWLRVLPTPFLHYRLPKRGRLRRQFFSSCFWQNAPMPIIAPFCHFSAAPTCGVGRKIPAIRGASGCRQVCGASGQTDGKTGCKHCGNHRRRSLHLRLRLCNRFCAFAKLNIAGFCRYARHCLAISAGIIKGYCVASRKMLLPPPPHPPPAVRRVRRHFLVCLARLCR